MQHQSVISPQSTCSTAALLRTLDAGMCAKLTLMLIPDRANAHLSPEAGQTRVLDRWAAAQLFPVQRMSLTHADAQPDAFLNGLLGALVPIIQPVFVPGLTVEDRLADIVDAILDVPTDFALLIFGYDIIQSQAVHRLLSRILDYQPPQMHMYLVVRAVPPLPCLPRMRVRRQLVEVTCT